MMENQSACRHLYPLCVWLNRAGNPQLIFMKGGKGKAAGRETTNSITCNLSHMVFLNVWLIHP